MSDASDAVRTGSQVVQPDQFKAMLHEKKYTALIVLALILIGIAFGETIGRPVHPVDALLFSAILCWVSSALFGCGRILARWELSDSLSAVAVVRTGNHPLLRDNRDAIAAATACLLKKAEYAWSTARKDAKAQWLFSFLGLASYLGWLLQRRAII